MFLFKQKIGRGVKEMILVFIIALVGIIYIYSQHSIQKDILDFQMQEMRCEHCIFNPGISVLNGGRISICKYRQSPTRCDRDSIIAMYSCSMEDRQKAVERESWKLLEELKNEKEIS